MADMEFWEQIRSGEKRFKYGHDSYRLAAEISQKCSAFYADDDDETVTEDERSCYNCRYRRWTVDSFECMKS